MLQGLDDTKLFVLMGAGAAMALAGLVLLFRPQAGQATTFIDVLGLKFRSSSVGLIVFIIGAAFMATPLVIPERPEGSENGIGPIGSPNEDQSIPDGGQRPQVETGDIIRPRRAQAKEIEPNDHISEANQIEIGNTYGGSISSQDEDWYVFRTSDVGAKQLRVILRLDEARGGAPQCIYYLYDESERSLGNRTASRKNPGTKLFDVSSQSVYYLSLSSLRRYTEFCAYELALSLE